MASNNNQYDWGNFLYVPYPVAEISSDFNELNLCERIVLMVILNYCTPQGVCYASKVTIAKKAGVCRTTAFNAISQLEEKGWIKRVSPLGLHGSIYPINRSLDYLKERKDENNPSKG